MAKVQIIMPVTLDGFLPDKNEELMDWLRTDRNGFPYWEERATFNMFPHYGMLDLMDAKERRDNNCTFFMKVQDEKSAEYAGGVFLFRLADELVIYLLPISYKSGKNLTGKIHFGQWTLRESKTFRNNVCRLVYRLKEKRLLQTKFLHFLVQCCTTVTEFRCCLADITMIFIKQISYPFLFLNDTNIQIVITIYIFQSQVTDIQ